MKKQSITAITGIMLAGSITLALAQSNPINERKELMKGVGAAAKTASALAKGEQPFDLNKAKEALGVYASAAKKFPGLFPDNSKTGGETTAAPKIWDDMAGFKAANAKFEKDVADALSATKDLDSFKAAFGKVMQNCSSCHEAYRIKKS